MKEDLRSVTLGLTIGACIVAMMLLASCAYVPTADAVVCDPTYRSCGEPQGNDRSGNGGTNGGVGGGDGGGGSGDGGGDSGGGDGGNGGGDSGGGDGGDGGGGGGGASCE